MTSDPGGFLPTFLTRTDHQATLDGMTTTAFRECGQARLFPPIRQRVSDANIVAFLSSGSSIYHGGSAGLTRRYARRFPTDGGYTWSHLIDDTTAEVFSTSSSARGEFRTSAMCACRRTRR